MAPILRFRDVGFNADVSLTELGPPEKIISGAHLSFFRINWACVLSLGGLHAAADNSLGALVDFMAGFAPELYGAPISDEEMLDVQVICALRGSLPPPPLAVS